MEQARRHEAAGAGDPVNSLVRGVSWALDRMVSVGYGVVYDYIVARFAPYRDLHAEVVQLLESSVPADANRRDLRVLDVSCGPGSFTTVLAESGFDTVGIDAYDALVELAREKRRARHLSNLSFRHADLARGDVFRDESFDRVVNIHSLYVQADAQRLLAEAFRVLKPGGQAVFVNLTRRVHLVEAFREVRGRQGLKAAMSSLLWVLPNAIFESMRRRTGPHYWDEAEFRTRLEQAGFRVRELRRTFFSGVSLLSWVEKEGGPAETPVAGEGEM
ncbi:MAG TPA: class I SAM-dependent methyltransferase [Vicinamibacteria bacterium]|nr:class I SAM-dependent methyltransferase [Vicinamibacteria bacterium]